MIQEYLLKSPDEKDNVEAYNPPKGIAKRMFSADDGNCWYVQFSENGENEKIAKRLSDVDEYVRKTFNVTVLEHECSAYFTKRLYPLISVFEHKLRKLLYLTSAINHDEKSTSNISDLESKDFGEIFTLLFIDQVFMGKVKEKLNKQNREEFSKAGVIAVIESIDENTLWDVLLGKDSVPTLRKRFDIVREYRNDVMHSHHITWKRFKDIMSLYKKVNDELNLALSDIEVTESKAKPTFNKTLEGALQNQKQLLSFENSFKPIFEYVYKLSELDAKKFNASLDALKSMSEISYNFDLYSEMRRSLEDLKNYKFIIRNKTTEEDKTNEKKDVSNKDNDDGGNK